MAAILIALYITSLRNYLLFHSLVELFSIVVACGIFVLTWYTRKLTDNGYLLFIGISLLFIAGIDLLHLMAYKGVGIFIGYGTNLATQLWMAGRFTQSISFLVAPIFIVRKFNEKITFFGYFVLEIILIASIFYWRIFPVCFIEGVGLTPFKIIGEYIISVTLFLSLLYLRKMDNMLEPFVVRLLSAAIVTAILSELAFTLYTDPYGLFNMLGHFLKIISFYLIFKAIIVVGLTQPYTTLFRNLKLSEERLSETLKGVTLSGIGDAVITTDASGNVVVMNTVAESLTGITGSDAAGKPADDVLIIENESTKEIRCNPIDRVIEIGASVSFEKNIILISKEGKRFNIDGHISPIRNAQGNTVGAILVFRDITTEKRDELERRLLAERINLLLESTDQGIYTTGPDRNVTLINKAALQILQYDRSEVLGRNSHSLFHHHRADGSMYREEQCPISWALLTGQGTHIDDEVFWRKDGTPFPAEYSVYPIIEGGKIDGAVVTFADITERRQSERLIEALSDISRDIGSTLEFDEIMKRVVIKAARAVDADAAKVILQDASGWKIAYTYGLQYMLSGTQIDERDIEVAEKVAQTKSPIVITEEAHTSRMGALLSVPLFVKDKVIGVLSFNYLLISSLKPANAQIDFAHKLALTVSIALENARLYTAEHNISQTLQSAIIYKPEIFPGIEIGYRYKSATDLARIGGDFYDFFNVENKKVGLFIGDVLGKGLDAAAITFMVKSTLRAYAYQNSNPSYVFAAANDAIRRQLRNGQFVTAIYGVIDVESGNVELASAGHPDPYLCTVDECKVMAASRSFPLGVFPGSTYETFNIRLKPKESLIF
ncbi:MAG: SpoIIE family protein phosphatase [Rubrobacteridae bacterium]|nr:SpoIIE family protein phosphatase [Rubrobacteridae bacterium]